MFALSQAVGRGVVARRGLVAAVLIAAAAVPLAAQGTEPRIEVQGRGRPGAVILRWVPTTSRAWASGLISGYRIERAAASTPTAFSEIAQVAPWTPQQWRQRVDTANKYLMSAAEVLFAQAPDPTEGRSALTPEERQADVDRRWTFGLIVADFDSLAAEAMGMRYVDRTAGTGEFIYRVSLRAAPQEYASVVIPVAPGTTQVATAGGPGLGAPPGLEIETGDSRLTLRWNPEPAGSLYIGYDIERTDAATGTVTRLSAVPLIFSDDSLDQPVPRIVTDTGLVNGRTYRYRVAGMTAFGERSEAALGEGTPRDLTPPPPPLITGGAASPAGVTLAWDMSDSTGFADLSGFLIARSASDEGPFVFDTLRVLPASARTAGGLAYSSDSANYFVIAARDSSGNVSYSMPWHVPVIDSVPPAAPTGLQASADSLGRVTVSWIRGRELDLLGWRVYRANAEDHVFTLLTGDALPDSVFRDSVDTNTLTRSIFYEVTALDLSENASPPTRVRLTLPDVNPPVEPIITRVTPSDSAVTLEFVPSSSEDIRMHRVMRRVAGESTWQEVSSVAPGTTVVVDRDVVKRQTYLYLIEAVDSSGLRASSSPVQARPFDTGVRPGVDQVTASWNEANGTVTLSWQYSRPASGEYWFVVHRAVGEARLDAYRTAGTELRFVDDAVRSRGRRHRYALQVVYRDGGVSQVSQPVEVQVPPR
jgi:hypothetical protein